MPFNTVLGGFLKDRTKRLYVVLSLGFIFLILLNKLYIEPNKQKSCNESDLVFDAVRTLRSRGLEDISILLKHHNESHQQQLLHFLFALDFPGVWAIDARSDSYWLELFRRFPDINDLPNSIPVPRDLSNYTTYAFVHPSYAEEMKSLAALKGLNLVLVEGECSI